MKYFIVSCLVLLAGVSAQDDPDAICKSCEYGVKVFFGHASSEYGTRFQIATLSRDVCPQFDRPFRCDYGVGKHWSGINHIIYSDDVAPYVCSGLTGQNCTELAFNINREFTCSDCMRDVALLAEQYTYPRIYHGLTYYLQHDGYCQDPVLGLNDREIKACQENLEGFMGPAMRGLDAAYASNSQAICHYWYKGVCPEPDRVDESLFF